MRLPKVDFCLVQSGVQTSHSFFRLKFYLTGNQCFRLFQHLETESHVKAQKIFSHNGGQAKTKISMFVRECDVACVHMLHYNARVTCASSFMEIQ